MYFVKLRIHLQALVLTESTRWALLHSFTSGAPVSSFYFGFGAGRHTPVPVLVESMCNAATSVVCGQNCTFLVTNSGQVLACGEGSYGRLSLGNSEDVYTPTLISALQGRYYPPFPWQCLHSTIKFKKKINFAVLNDIIIAAIFCC